MDDTRVRRRGDRAATRRLGDAEVLYGERGAQVDAGVRDAIGARSAALPTYIEASSERSAALYERLGFVHMDVLELPEGGPPVWPMRRPPTGASQRRLYPMLSSCYRAELSG
jgi:hypothetical protein